MPMPSSTPRVCGWRARERRSSASWLSNCIRSSSRSSKPARLARCSTSRHPPGARNLAAPADPQHQEEAVAFFDLPWERLQEYRPERAEPSDFDSFWQDTLSAARAAARPATFTPVETPLQLVACWDVTFSGFGGQPVKAWYVTPRSLSEPLRGVVEFLGYGGGRGFPTDWLLWPTAGCALLVMDTRGQGSAWMKGDTSDVETAGNPQFPGFMTRGVLDPATYYYRRVMTDAARAIDT